MMEIIISENQNHISIHVVCDDENSLSWEQLQSIKDTYFPEKKFCEIFPEKDQVVNKANVRHLFHLKHFELPSLSDLEEDSEIKIYRI